MYKFNKQQTYTPAKTAPFKYDLYNIMPPKKIDEIITDDRGKEFIITDIENIKEYYDTDNYKKTDLSGEFFLTTRGTTQKITVREYYPRGSFGAARYRKYVTGFNIRIA